MLTTPLPLMAGAPTAPVHVLYSFPGLGRTLVGASPKGDSAMREPIRAGVWATIQTVTPHMELRTRIAAVFDREPVRIRDHEDQV